ncbi:MAG: glycosyltransferase family 2 protein [Bacillota bacterium]
MPFLSIIVPVYKVEPYLRQCINSILDQTFNDFELILVDDGSPDNCPQICDEYAEKDNRIKVIHKENGGLVSARKIGLKAATGKYIGYVDSDDWIEVDMYNRLCEAAKLHSADIVICDMVKNYQDKEVKQEQIIKPGLYNKEAMNYYLYPIMLYSGEFYKFGLHPSVSNKIFKRDLIEKNQHRVKEEIKLGEDVACTIPCLLDAEIIYVLDKEYLYHYRQIESSMTNSYDGEFLGKTLVLYEQLKELVEEKSNNKPNLIEQLHYYLSYLVIAAVNNELSEHNKKSANDKIKFIQKMILNKNINEAINAVNIKQLPLRSKVYIWLLQRKQISVLYSLIMIVRRKSRSEHKL